MLTSNKDLREKMRKDNVPIWKLADALGISETTTQRMLRRELTGEKLHRVQQAIEAIKRERDSNE